MTLQGQANGSFPGGTPSILWSQVSGPITTITSPTSTNSTVSGYVAGTYEYRISTTCLDGSNISDNVTITVKPIVTANAGAAVALCPGTYSLAANNPSPGTGTWTVVAGQNKGITISDTKSPTSAISVRADTSGTTTLRWTISQTTTGTACTSSDDIVITNLGGVAAIDAGPNQTLSNCYTTTHSASLNASYGGSGINGQQGTWSQVSGPSTASFSNATIAYPLVSNLAQGTYVFRWTVSGPCVNGSDDVQITVPAPSSGLTNVANMNAQTFCDGRTSTVLTATQPAFSGESASWSVVAGTGTFTNPTSYNTTVSDMSSGDNIYRYTITSTTGCSVSKDVTVTATTPPTITVSTATPVVLNCGVSSTTINFTTTGGIGTTQFRIISAPAGYALPSYWTNANTTTTAFVSGISIPGTYLVRIIRYGTNSCDAAVQDIPIVVSRNPTLSNAGTDQLLACNVTVTALAGNIPGAGLGTGSWSQVSGPNTAVIANPSQYNSNITGLVPGAYDFKWIINAGNGCTPSEAVVRVRVANTTPTTANAGADRTSLCYSSPVKLDANNPALNEVGTWTVTPSTGITFSSVNDPKAVVSGLASGTTYKFIWTIVNGCGSTNDDVIITTNSTQGAGLANAGTDKCFATGTPSITMGATNPSPATATGTWALLSGPNTPTITNTASATSTVTGLASGTYTFTWSLKVGGCEQVTDTVVHTIAPTLTVSNAGAGQTLCAANTSLAGNTATVGTGTWSQVAGPGGVTILDPLSPTSSVNGLSSGLYKFRWTIASGVCSNYSDVIVNVSTPPSAAAVLADSTCLARTTLASMTGNTPASGFGVWSQVSGPNLATITTASLPTSGLSGLINGNYVFRWTITGGTGCAPSTADMNVSVNMPVAASLNNVNICNSTSTTLTGSTNISGLWTQTAGPSSTTIQALPPNQAAVSGLQSGSYTFQFAPSTVSGCPSQTPKTVTLTNSAPASTANAGADKALCNVTSFSLSANTPTTGTGAWSRVSGPNSPGITGSTTSTPTMNSVVAGTYTYRWTITNGGCTSADDIVITNSAAATTATAGANQTVCSSNGTATLNGNTPTTGTGSWMQVSGPGSASFSNTASPAPTLSGLTTAGNYVFRYTISNGACSNNSQTTVQIDEVPTANAGPNDNTCVPTYTLKATPASAGSGAWSQVSGPASTISNPAAYNSTVTGLKTRSSYVYRWTVTNGAVCPAATSDVTISVCNIILPVSLLSFTGHEENGTARLRWEVTAERELDRYEVERSSSGNDFRTVGTVVSAGRNSYVYTYQEAFAEGSLLQHYRLKMIDRNGQVRYSNLLQIRRNSAITLVQCVPNPATGIFRLQVDHSRSEKADIAVMNAGGQVVLRQTVSLQKGQQVLTLDRTAGLPSGTYQIVLALPDGQQVKLKATLIR